jgi:hypothetical protein
MAGRPFRGMVVDVSLDPVVGHEQSATNKADRAPA